MSQISCAGGWRTHRHCLGLVVTWILHTSREGHQGTFGRLFSMSDQDSLLCSWTASAIGSVWNLSGATCGQYQGSTSWFSNHLDVRLGQRSDIAPSQDLPTWHWHGSTPCAIWDQGQDHFGGQGPWGTEAWWGVLCGTSSPDLQALSCASWSDPCATPTVAHCMEVAGQTFTGGSWQPWRTKLDCGSFCSATEFDPSRHGPRHPDHTSEGHSIHTSSSGLGGLPAHQEVLERRTTKHGFVIQWRSLVSWPWSMGRLEGHCSLNHCSGNIPEDSFHWRQTHWSAPHWATESIGSSPSWFGSCIGGQGEAAWGQYQRAQGSGATVSTVVCLGWTTNGSDRCPAAALASLCGAAGTTIGHSNWPCSGRGHEQDRNPSRPAAEFPGWYPSRLWVLLGFQTWRSIRKIWSSAGQEGQNWGLTISRGVPPCSLRYALVPQMVAFLDFVVALDFCHWSSSTTNLFDPQPQASFPASHFEVQTGPVDRAGFHLRPFAGARFGEASHPGPSCQDDPLELPPLEAHHLRLGCSNPCGFRGKEQIAIGLGTGIWHYSETHLTLDAQRASTRALRHFGRAAQREVRCHFGAPVMPRVGSLTAGTWSGVGVHSDFPSQPLQVAWPDGEYTCGRAMLTRHFVAGISLHLGTCYGFPTCPTWPAHKTLNQSLFRTFSRELVVGSSGPRAILGDFNCDRDTPGEFEVWKRYGWMEAQALAQQMWGCTPQATCKNATQVDQIWLSPELIGLCRSVGLVPLFPDHQTLFVDLHIPSCSPVIRTWPLPSPIPWQDLDVPAWHESYESVNSIQVADGTDFLTQWCQHWETSLDEFCATSGHGRLPSHCKGRAQRTQPIWAHHTPPVAKASRPGEATLRSDFVSEVLLRWYKQLRRLQSYKHAALANSDSLNAEHYRLSVWMAIRRASGFQDGFPSWWAQRSHATLDAPDLLPMMPPPGDVAVAIYEDFHRHFQRFEAWTIRQRTALVKQKYDRSCQALFQDLRDSARDQLDLLWESHDYTILAFDSDTGEIHVDSVPLTSQHSSWHFGGHALILQSQDADVLCFQQLPPSLEPGDCIQQRITLTAEKDIHQALCALWKPRWQKMGAVDEATWNRILGFVQAYMPQLHFDEPCFDVPSWKRTLSKFPKHAARGVDGISVQDLQSLPEAVLQQLMDFFQTSVDSSLDWPSQLLFGKVINLAKIPGAHLASHYRPVVIFGVLYRAWSRHCARPLLRQLSHLVPSGALGFLPSRESAQIWVQIQAFIEICCQQRLNLCGFSSDIEKCFNNIGRAPLMFLAKHIGFPEAILAPWQQFLSSCTRAFVVRNSFSDSLTSTHGVPEGCAMSVIGMVLIDWAYHCYMQALTPQVHVFSYVDNLSIAGTDPLQIVSAFFSTICFFQLWGLLLDHSKTFCWGTETHGRNMLKMLGLPISFDARELGGTMTYGRGRRNRHLKARGNALTDKWLRLRRSRSPVCYKLAVLPLVFWSSALHGCASCPVGKTYIHDLRQQALKALNWRLAGSNGLLRLSLSVPMTADPGFFQVLTTLQTFCRICWKASVLLECWRLWWMDSDASITQGPFGQLLAMLSVLNWHLLVPPLIQDRSGLVHNLLLLDGKFLRVLLEDAWLQNVAHVACTRPSMAALVGLDVYQNRGFNAKLTAHQLSLQLSLQSGCFIDQWTHSKYDVSVSRVCKFCLVPNTHEHVLVCNHLTGLRAKRGLTSSELLAWPRPFALHLLCSRSPYVDQLRGHFAALPNLTGEFLLGPTDAEIQHLFTDGSCFCDGRSDTDRAAWAVYHSGHKAALSGGHLHGLPQSIGRAELAAVLSALCWSDHFQIRVHLWIDSSFVHEGLQHRLRGGITAPGDRHADMWFEVDRLLEGGNRQRITASWIPAHLCPELCTSPFEEWIAEGNGGADSLAVQMNSQRPAGLMEVVRAQHDWDQLWSERRGALRGFYQDVFEMTHARCSERPPVVVESSDDEGTLYSFSYYLLVDPFLPDLPDEVGGYPSAFVQSILGWICRHEDSTQSVQPLSFVELTVGLLFCEPISWPHRNPLTGTWEWRSQHTQYERPTFGSYYSVVRKLMPVLIDTCCHSPLIVHGLNRSHLGISLPLDDFGVALGSATRDTISQHLLSFTASRAIRRSADYARPI